MRRLFETNASGAIILIRLMVGVVFLSEGLQKFIYPEIRGAGRFEDIGLAYPEFLGLFVGTFEVVCGFLILLGLFTRLASLPLIVIMIVALYSTKLEIFTEEGFWVMAHAARTDWSMLLGSIFLLIRGGGSWSVDKRWIK